MTAASLLACAPELLLAVATPGPAMLAVIGGGLSQGSQPGLRMAAGVAVADIFLGLPHARALAEPRRRRLNGWSGRDRRRALK
jgi:threonine/homoserine/homoserine lactone efflux protein